MGDSHSHRWLPSELSLSLLYTASDTIQVPRECDPHGLKVGLCELQHLVDVVQPGFIEFDLITFHLNGYEPHLNGGVVERVEDVGTAQVRLGHLLRDNRWARYAVGGGGHGDHYTELECYCVMIYTQYIYKGDIYNWVFHFGMVA